MCYHHVLHLLIINKIPQGIRQNLNEVIEFKPEDSFIDTLKDVVKSSKDNLKVGFATDTTSYATYMNIKQITNPVELAENPVSEMRSIKNEREMESFKDSISKSDKAIVSTIKWLNQELASDKRVSEKDLEEKMKQEHFNHGANGLSFSVIPASGSNGAIVHYEKGDPDKMIQKGDLILLDTGGYYDAGLATDSTRTFIAGDIEAAEKQKEIYTTVLKGHLRGINAELPPNPSGNGLDKIVRTPVKEKGYDYLHSTGHGIGIACHENPPFISSKKGRENEIKEGMVFSIEPGIYIEGWGGVRIENLATIVPHPEKPGWHKVQTLSYAPFDNNLINKDLLTDQEKSWLNDYEKESKRIYN